MKQGQTVWYCYNGELKRDKVESIIMEGKTMRVKLKNLIKELVSTDKKDLFYKNVFSFVFVRDTKAKAEKDCVNWRLQIIKYDGKELLKSLKKLEAKETQQCNLQDMGGETFDPIDNYTENVLTMLYILPKLKNLKLKRRRK